MKLCLDVFAGIPYEELLPLAREVGFDGFFSGEVWADHLPEMQKMRQLADCMGMLYETSHSTIPGCTTLWQDGEDGDAYVALLKRNLDHCAEMSVPIMVVHVQIDRENPGLFVNGIRRLETVVEYAKAKQVKIAFENINSAELLFRTLEHFPEPEVGFCYDCGHEACHTPEVRYLPILGKRLFCTHIHDNDGHGDQHRIPFDGSIDFAQIAKEWKTCGCQGNLTMELCYSSDDQKQMTKRDFLQKSFDVATKLRSMFLEEK